MRRCLAVLLLALAAVPSPAQKKPDPEADGLLRAMLASDKETYGNAQQEYTYRTLHHNLNYIHGKLTSDHTYLSEQIFIGGKPYIRRLEYDGKPLAGKALAHETEMYDQAVAERTGLDSAERSRRLKVKTKSVTGASSDELAEHFDAEIAGTQQVSGRPCTVLQLTPKDPNAVAHFQRRIRYCLDRETRQALETRIEFLADDGLAQKGSVLDNRYAFQDGVLLPVEMRVETVVAVKNFGVTREIHLVATDTFSDFHRFKTSTRLLSEDELKNVETRPSEEHR